MRRTLRWLGHAFGDPFVIAVALFTVIVLVGVHQLADRLDDALACDSQERLVIERRDERTTHLYIDRCWP